jgi:hypothetical protein
MWWHVSLLLIHLLLNGLLDTLDHAEALSQCLFKLWDLADFDQNLVAFVEESTSECGEADLHHGSIEIDLVRNVLLADQLWKL